MQVMFRYDKRIKPPVVGSLGVNVSVVLLSLSSPDESSLVSEPAKEKWKKENYSIKIFVSDWNGNHLLVCLLFSESFPSM